MVISEDACAGCLARAKRCPTNGAVRIVNLPAELTTGVIHRYGPNSFKLHGLPSPRSGCVLGMLGQNGTGKSTALKVLAGKLKPNLGKLEEPRPTWKDIVAYHRGSDLQQYLTRLLEGNLKVVTKVQLDTDYVAKLRGKVVQDVLKKCDDRGAMEDLVRRLELEAVLTREVQQLSGGELQRFACCAVALREADVYMFDESSSYLDIKQRVTMTEVIRELATRTGPDGQSKYVIVVEHDLAVLDYMSDYVNCLYGEPGAYGVVTKIATNTVGINNYLAGYFPAENMRFRADALTFEVKGGGEGGDATAAEPAGPEPANESNAKLRIEYPNMSKTLGGPGSKSKSKKTFTLHVEAGSFSGNDCVGLLGQNGCGKTTFMDMLAGKYDKEEGEGGQKSFKDMGVSYKPQIYAPKLRKFPGTTQDFFEKYAGVQSADRLFRLMVMKPLRIPQLWEANVSELSGGELQRVAIAMCLAQPANIYLLDEPSAGLDCEQRVVTAKVIRRWVINHLGRTAMVVEHDFVMASALSDRVVLYEGTPGVECTARSPTDLVEGFNNFLSQLDVTFRRDPANFRPRVNKRGSLKDQEQKATNTYFVFDTELTEQ